MYTNKTLKELIENAKIIAETEGGKQEKEESLEEIFKDIDKKYGLGEDKPPELTDEEIREKAESDLTKEYQKSLDKIISGSASGGAAVSASKAEEGEKLARKTKSIESAYEELLKQTKNKAIKQGIARSSIFEGSAQNLEEKNQAILPAPKKTLSRQ